MKIKELIYLIKPPCPKCPYTLGQARFVASPCPSCRKNGYNMYRVLAEGKHTPHGYTNGRDGDAGNGSGGLQ